jgi:hypothetical protein
MPLPDEIFWNKVNTWKTRQARISIECWHQSSEKRFEGTVSNICGCSVTFRETGSEEELTFDFDGAEIRFHPCEPMEAVVAFGAMWEPEVEPFVLSIFTELRDFGNPS